jgi:hypothetical protein
MKNDKAESPQGSRLDRRGFLKSGLISSALFLSSNTLLSAFDSPVQSRSHAKLHSLRPGAVKPDGCLRVCLQKQAGQLGISLPAVSEPFSRGYSAGEEKCDTEFFRALTSRDVHETCDIADHTWTWGYLLQATGDGIWADRIERVCFDTGFGAIKKDWKGVQYLSCPKLMLATHLVSRRVIHLNLPPERNRP